MRLTFKNGKFVLLEHDGKFSKFGDYWKSDKDGYSTTYVPAVAPYQRFADDVALKVLNRVFVKFYKAKDWKLPEHIPKEDPHQREGICWILTRSRSYLAHAPGAGKTYQAIVASHLTEGPGQVLFIVPPSLTLNWEREIHKFHCGKGWPRVSIVPLSACKESMGWDARYLIVPDSMLQKDWVLEELIRRRKSFKFVAVDEASRFKEPRALRSIALFGGRKGSLRSPGLLYHARHSVLMDGSPMPNRPMELWAPLYAMTPETIDFMPERDFGFRYCGAKMNDWGEWDFRGASRQDELHEKVTRSFMHVVLEDRLSHPERRRSVVVLNKDTRSAELKNWERKNLVKIMGHFLGGPKMPDKGELAKRRRELGLSKIPLIASYVLDRAEKDESILLFAWHREVVLALSEKLKRLRPAVIMGGTDSEDREKWFSEFQAGRCKLIIGNIAAMGRGHNLQRADRVIFGEYSWTDEFNKQCEKRASRRGSEKSFVRCEYLVVPNSIDEHILSSIFTKSQNVKKVIG